MEAIIERALLETVTNIGQLSPADIKYLNNAVKLGILAKGKGGTYPVIKTVWGPPGMDFVADRRRLLKCLGVQ